ncbi:hypothetical protein CAI21_03120 [Alkalilimnicola ehrlichii]|uniref:SH3b domain-containing protein n=1 Tax=Alkalilimnicola ehrlichii TaxID=351052 RepID=A0A3E0X0J0_9GAMM|nr:hypothetical protein [Alkalilimnicola ehrlichii]RFA30980.1 hypothetical protein CAI21_03120 [Alkalilimnicola ehrlichii]RFA38932.1 hypothetical protein CAL65_03265 [Alkalilimnicola ehrlichii]
MLGRLLLVFSIVALPVAIGGGFWWADVSHDRKYEIAILAPTEIYAEHSEAAYPRSNVPVAVLPAGAQVQVRRMVYGKDYQAFLIREEGGEAGWIVSGPSIAITPPPSR